MLKLEFWSSAWSHSCIEVVYLSLAPPSTDQLKVGSAWLHDASDGQEPLYILSVDELLATKHIDKVECLRQHLFSLRVNHAHNWIMRRLHQLRLLDDDAHFVIVAAIDLFKCLDHQLVQLCVPVKNRRGQESLSLLG